MSVRVATANQSQALTRSLAASTGAPRKDPGDASFDGLLSNLADDQATGALPPSTTPDKDAAGPKTPPNGTPSPPSDDAAAGLTAALDASSAMAAGTGVLSLATLAGKTAAAWTGLSGASGAKAKTTHADTKADAADSAPTTPQADPSASAGLSPQLSLLALVQSAAALPSSNPSTASVGDPAVSSAAVPTAPVVSNGMQPLSGDQKGASTPPLISDIAFQNYLAPVSTTPVLPQPAVPDTTRLADAKPQADVALNFASGVPALAVSGGTPIAGSFNGVAASSATDASSDSKPAIASADRGASLDQGLGISPLRGNVATPTPDDAPANAIASAQIGAGGPSAVSAPLVWNPSVSAPSTSTAAISDPLAAAALQSTVPRRLASASAPPASAPPLAAPPGAGPSFSAALASATDDAASVIPGAPVAPVLASAVSASDPPVPSLADVARGTGAPVTAPLVDAAIGVPVASALPMPLQSVADAITSLAAQPAAAVPASADSASRLAPARTMLLQLNPGELGTVSVRLHLTGRTLDVSLTASQDQTAALLDHGRDALTRAISDQDYQVNALVIQRGDPQRDDPTSLPGNSNATSTDNSRGQATSQGGGDMSGGSGRQGADGAPARQERSDRQPQPRAVPSARGSGLFV